MQIYWHTKKIGDIFELLNTSKEGLTEEEVQKRLQKYGPNALPESKTDSLIAIFLHQFQSPLIYILFLASWVVWVMGEYVDSAIILFVLLFNAVVGTLQEGKAQNTLLALKKFTDTLVRVRRSNAELIIPDKQIVPGDIILLQEGDKIPADARIIHSNDLTLNEAALTGESHPIHKFPDTLSNLKLPISEQRDMVFKGTNVVAGNGQVVVVSTGLNTSLGQVSKEIALINTEIPLKTDIRDLTKLIIITIATICSSIFILGVLIGHSIREMFTTVVSLSVSIIPEGLPIVTTLVLASGVWRMSKRNALIKKLQAVEALGQARVIAVDKTGTITQNKMLLQKVYINGRNFQITGMGYDPKGEVLLDGKRVDPHDFQELILAGKIAALGTNTGTFFNKDSQEWQATGDPTESALTVFAQKVGFHKDNLEREALKLSEIPFSYRNKYHTTTHRVDGRIFTTVVGAPETILDLSTRIWNSERNLSLAKSKKDELEAIFLQMSGEGLRVLAFATINTTLQAIQPKNVKNLTFAGFFGINDPLRPEVHEAMKKAMSAGIKVLMITGDHKITAEAIAKEAGIYHEGDLVLTGEDMDRLSDGQLAEILENVSVFARVTPEHKLRIIKTYKKKGEIIAMTGDGVSDAPSLVAADLGVAMGKIGTEVAKEASDIVLLDDNFGSIISAVEEGRSIYKTIKKVILYLFSTSLGESLTIIGALFLGFPLPISAAQIVWLNLVTDGFLDVSLAMEPQEEGLLRGNFERPRKYLLDALTIKRIFTMAIPMMVGTLFLFSKYYQADLSKAWTIALTTLAVFQWFNAWNCRHETKSIFSLNPFSNKFLVGATGIVIFLQIQAIYNPLMQRILKTTPLDLSDWLAILPVACTIVIVEELRKYVYRKMNKKTAKFRSAGQFPKLDIAIS